MEATPTPSICVSQHNRFSSPQPDRRSPPYSLRSPASPMPIRSTSRDPPPALPPPQHPDIDDDVSIGSHKGWDWFNKEYVNQHWTDFGKAGGVKPGSSLLGGKRPGSGSAGAEGEENARSNDNEIDPERRGSSMSTITPGAPEFMYETTGSSDREDGGSKPSNYRCVASPFPWLSCLCSFSKYFFARAGVSNTRPAYRASFVCGIATCATRYYHKLAMRSGSLR